jgi:hypothetical protein
MTKKTPGEPKIFVEVFRPVPGGGHYAQSRTRKEISLTEWEQARDPGHIAAVVINQCLAEVDYKP